MIIYRCLRGWSLEFVGAKNVQLIWRQWMAQITFWWLC